MKKHYPCLFSLIVIAFFIGCVTGSGSSDLEKKARRIHESAITIDTHLDTPLRLLNKDWDIGVRHDPLQVDCGKLDLPRMIEGGLDAAIFAVFVSQANRDLEGYVSARHLADRMIEAIQGVTRNYPDLVESAYTTEDIRRIHKIHKRAIIMGMENGFPLGQDLSFVQFYYDQGIRYITLCHTRNNDICDSSTDPSGAEWHGLSPFGKQVIQEMNRLGMIIDVSHISDEAFFDVIELSQAPVIASHSCCRAVYSNPRNLTDSMLVVLAEHDGVAQINLCSFYLKELTPNPPADSARKVLRAKYGSYYTINDQALKREYLHEIFKIDEMFPSERATVKDLVDHIDHAVKIAGIDHVGIGSDFDGGAEIEGCMEVSQLPNITIELMRRGYSEKEIRKIWGENFLRVFKEVEMMKK